MVHFTFGSRGGTSGVGSYSDILEHFSRTCVVLDRLTRTHALTAFPIPVHCGTLHLSQNSTVHGATNSFTLPSLVMIFLILLCFVLTLSSSICVSGLRIPVRRMAFKGFVTESKVGNFLASAGNMSDDVGNIGNIRVSSPLRFGSALLTDGELVHNFNTYKRKGYVNFSIYFRWYSTD